MPPARSPHLIALAMASLGVNSSHAQTAQDAPATLPAVEVVGRTASGAYHAGDAAGAKTELRLRELPQAVRVLTRQAIDDLGATKLDDVLDYVGGVSRQNNFGGLWDNIAVRGLAGNENTGMATLLNGFSSNRGFNAPRDLAGVERIEFLKGPAAALYGSSEPGGTLNIVSKRPLWKAGHALEVYGGSFDLKRAALDSTGPLSDTLAYRLNVAIEDRDSFRDHIHARREVVAPAFSLKLGADTMLDYNGELLRHRTPLDRGVVATADGKLGVIPRERFLGEPADGDVTVDNRTHQLILSHDWSDHWRGRLGLAYRETGIHGFSTEPTALRTDGTLTRQRRMRDYDSDDLALQAELQGRLRAAGVVHEVLLGAETFRFDMDTVMLRVNPSTASPYAINIYQPVYGQPQPTPAANTDTLEHQRGTAFYAQDAITLAPQWRLLAGVRVDSFRQSLLNRRTIVTTRQDPSATSPRIGISWLPTSQWTVYASAGKSFRPNVGTDFGGQAFAPESGRALELGAKWESIGQRMGLTAALFDIRKRNVLTADPVNTGYSIAAGEVGSRGLELDFTGQVSSAWRVNASLVWNDVEVRRDTTLPTGTRLLNVPRVNGSLLAVYESSFANGQRYGLGGGLTHVGARIGQTATSFELPAYTTAKLVGHWRINPTLRATLDVDNLFDTTHYTSSYSRVWVTPGASRTMTLGLQAKF
ncbi:TonB-dependent siderophore receptor [Paucibacter sp. KBW04]|nr:TonB-dependent siderophore receptor [Paucibacter sp. KBW04]